MGLFKFKPALIGLTTVLSAATSLFAAVVDNTFDNDQNDFEYYWYYYDDNAGVGKDDRLQVKAPGTPSTISVTLKKDTTNLAGKPVKQYTFTTGTDAGENYASLPFKMGSNWTASYGDATPFVGIGTMLAENGESIDISKATALKFKIRSKSGSAMTVRCKIQDLPMDKYSEVLTPPSGAFAYFGSDVTVTSEWAEKTIAIPTGFEQPGWAATVTATGFPTTLDLTKATKLAWEVIAKAEVSDELMIKGVELVGMDFVSKSIWTHTSAKSPLPAMGQFATFQGTYPAQTPIKPATYWYAYNDADIQGNSTVTEATASYSEETKKLSLKFGDESGTDGAGKGAALDFTLGKSVQQNGATVQGFVGIGVNVYDSVNAKYFNATDSTIKSIYFHYMLDTDAPYATLEISDVLDVADATKPTSKDGRGAGVVWYRNLPKTNGEWVAVEIPFDSLVIHDKWVGAKNTPLDRTKLAKIQWKVQGTEGNKGILAIDNIFFPGAKCWPYEPIAVKNFSHSNQSSGFNVSYLNGNVNVNWSNNVSLSNGKVSLVNMQGAVVASTSIAKTSHVNASFSTKTLPAGMYFVKLNAVNTAGKAVAMQSKISFVK
jgi:hypothetical protein